LELATYNDDPPPTWWVKQQAEWDLQLRQTYLEGEMEGAEQRRVRETNTYYG
jgi:hypothetical protein